MSQSSKPTVPKFGSFKPKHAVSSPHIRDCDRDSDVVRDGSDKSHSKDRHHTSRSHDTKDERHQGEPKSKRPEYVDRQSIQRSPISVVTNQDEFEESNLFIVDRRGDAKNVEFGSLHRYSIPAYYRVGGGRVVGASHDDRIDREQSTDRVIVLDPRGSNKNARLKRPLLAQKNAVKGGERKLKILVSSDASTSAESLDFISLRPISRKRKRGSESPEINIDDFDYRSIEGKAKASTAQDDEDLESLPDSDVAEALNDVRIEARKKNAELSRKTKEEPSSLQAWLDVIDHQAQVIRAGSEDDELTSVERHTLAEIRLSIYDRALRHIPSGHPGHDQLALGMLETGGVIWDRSKLSTKWNEALDKSPRSVLLWTKYLDFIQSNTSPFTYANCKRAYIKCLHVLTTQESGSEVEILRLKVYIFLRFTCFARDAGFVELSCSLWQIILEYSFCHPADVLPNREAELEDLEDWWDAETPRIGEEGALGWNHFHINGAAGSKRRSTLDSYSVAPEKGTISATLEHEVRSMGKVQLPVATDDEEVDDPYQFVIFSDVKEIVECMLGPLPKRLVLDAWLCFMGLPPLPIDVEGEPKYTHSWYVDPFIHAPPTPLYYTDRKPAAATTTSEVGVRLWSQAWTSFHLIYNGSSVFPQPGSSDHAAAQFIALTLSSLVHRVGDDDTLVEYYLAFCVHTKFTEARKAAKRILKARPTGARLWNAYAIIEAKMGNLDKAVEVWKTALAGGFHSNDSSDEEQLLWHNWMLTLLHYGNEDEALGVLASMADGCANATEVVPLTANQVSAGKLLRVKQHLAEGLDASITRLRYVKAVVYIECLAWLEYLVSAHSIEDALEVLTRLGARISSSKDIFRASTELLHQCKANMIRWHVDHSQPYKPALLRLELHESLKLFPENSVICEALAKVRGNTKVEDKIRETAKSAMAVKRDEMGLIAWYHKIIVETQRSRATTATSNSVRALYVSALLDPESSVRHSSLLWWMWLRFECTAYPPSSKVGQSSQSKRVRQILYDGMRLLPWDKEWAIASLQLVYKCDGMEEEDARKILEVIEERGLRMSRSI